MKDPYSVEQALQQKTKPREKQNDTASMQDEIDQEIIREAERTEARNYKKAKAARMKLEKAAETQKGTTTEMKVQGEKIGAAKKAALHVHKNAEQADKLADKIEEESHMFNFSLPFVGRIKNWWSRNKKEEREIGEMEASAAADEGEAEVEADEGYESEEGAAEEYVPGQRKTDKELKKILHNVRRINKEASVQSKMASKQEVDLKDINKVNEYSKKKVDKTDFKLKKGL